MKRYEHWIITVLVTLPVYLLLIYFITSQFIAWIYFSKGTEKGFLAAHAYDTGNATYSYVLGRFYHNAGGTPDLKKAISSYRDSLRQSPLQGGCWLDLAKAYQTAGFRTEAGEALERAVTLIPKNPGVRWEAGVFFLISGNMEKTVQNFREFILLRPDRQDDVYDLVWKLSVHSHATVKNLMPASYPYYKQYLLYLIASNRTDESRDLWNGMTGFRAEDELCLRYADFLISKHHYQDAGDVWKAFIDRKFKAAGKGETPLIWNGSFEYEIQNRGFDWRIRETPGVDVFLDRDIHLSGNNSIGITFDGTENPGIIIASQVVRVVPAARYRFRGYIKTDSLTTRNGIFFSIAGHGCKGLNKRSEVITGTNFWREVTLGVDIPDGCNAVSVNIGREKSHKLDNKISGNAWIDDISLIRR